MFNKKKKKLTLQLSHTASEDSSQQHTLSARWGILCTQVASIYGKRIYSTAPSSPDLTGCDFYFMGYTLSENCLKTVHSDLQKITYCLVYFFWNTHFFTYFISIPWLNKSYFFFVQILNHLIIFTFYFNVNNTWQLLKALRIKFFKI